MLTQVAVLYWERRGKRDLVTLFSVPNGQSSQWATIAPLILSVCCNLPGQWTPLQAAVIYQWPCPAENVPFCVNMCFYSVCNVFGAIDSPGSDMRIDGVYYQTLLPHPSQYKMRIIPFAWLRQQSQQISLGHTLPESKIICNKACKTL